MSKQLQVAIYVLLFIVALIGSAVVNVIIDNPPVRAATIWYVNCDSGSDSNAGNITHPFATLQRALNATGTSDDIFLRGYPTCSGNYNNVYPTTQGWRLVDSGTLSDWVVIAGYPGETAVLNGVGYTLTNGYSLFNIGQPYASHVSYVRLTNLVVENATGASDSNSSYGIAGEQWAQSGGANHHIRIDNCTIRNCHLGAIKFTNELYPAPWIHNITVENCTIGNCSNRVSPSISWGETLSISGATYATIKDNSFTGCRKANIMFGSITSAGAYSSYANIFNNTIMSTSTTKPTHAIYISAATGGTGGYVHHVNIYNNKAWNTNDSAICIGTEAGAGTVANVSIYNNIVNITATGSSGSTGLRLQQYTGYTQLLDNITIKFNTFHESVNGYPLWIANYRTKLRNIYVVNNIFQGSSTNTYQVYSSTANFTDVCFKFYNNLYDHTTAAENTYWLDGTGKFEVTAVRADPLFVSRSTGNFHLNGTSPAIDAASGSYTVSFDYDYNSRPIGDGYDIGAFEVVNTTWYVSTTGNDANPGTLTQPFLTLRKAINASSGVDTIIMRGGNYNNHGASYIYINRSGTTTQPFTIRNYTGEKVVLDFSSTIPPSGYGLLHFYSFAVVYYHDIYFYGINFSNASTSVAKMNAYTGKGGNDNVTFSYCEWHNCTKWAINGYNPDYAPSLYIQYFNMNNCTLSDIGKADGFMGECVSFGGFKNFVYENNTIQNFTKQGLHLGAGTCWGAVRYNTFNNTNYFSLKIDPAYGTLDNSVHNVTIRNNLFTGIGSGASTRAMFFNPENQGVSCTISDINIYNNIFDVTAAGSGYFAMGFSLSGTAPTSLFKNINVTYNTFITRGGSSSSVPIYIVEGDDTISNCVIANNILTTSSVSHSYQLYVSDLPSTQTNFTLANNLYYRFGGTTGGGYYSNGYYIESSGLSSDPLFVSVSTGDLYVNSTSPVINAATTTYTVSADYVNVHRPQGAGYDIGAYEYYPFSPPPSGLVETTKVISHGLSITPTVVIVTPTSYPGSFFYYYVDTITSTTFTLHLLSLEGVTVSFMWKAMYT